MSAAVFLRRCKYKKNFSETQICEQLFSYQRFSYTIIWTWWRGNCSCCRWWHHRHEACGPCERPSKAGISLTELITANVLKYFFMSLLFFCLTIITSTKISTSTHKTIIHFVHFNRAYRSNGILGCRSTDRGWVRYAAYAGFGSDESTWWSPSIRFA